MSVLVAVVAAVLMLLYWRVVLAVVVVVLMALMILGMVTVVRHGHGSVYSLALPMLRNVISVH